jgi:isocitrate/isopropylmalate dehydrogenase
MVRGSPVWQVSPLTQHAGIGIEVTAATMEVLRAVQEAVGGFKLDMRELDYGSMCCVLCGARTTGLVTSY